MENNGNQTGALQELWEVKLSLLLALLLRAQIYKSGVAVLLF